MAPEIITNRNKNATIPVIEYKTTMATVDFDKEFSLVLGVAFPAVRRFTA